jgi:3-isopropylmalate/(R)-2-methylmalate dehydratase small subunit
MQTFVTLRAVAASLPLANIDTDKILAGRFLKTITRSGLGSRLFSELRFDHNGAERPGFVLNREPWRRAGILIALDNFGCGSSREHAPWALLDFGIRCVIAPSFADIFYNNCFKNGILPIALDGRDVAALMADAELPEQSEMYVDLPLQRITRTNGESIAFDLAEDRKQALLNGLDELAETLLLGSRITHWEQTTKRICPEIPRDIPLSSTTKKGRS